MQPMTLASRFAGNFPGAALEALADSLRAERRLLEQLVAVTRRQRAAVLRDDFPAVEESVFSIHRVLHTLTEARRRRRSLDQALGEFYDRSPRGPDEASERWMREELHVARRALEETAGAVTHEVETTRRVLLDALSRYIVTTAHVAS